MILMLRIFRCVAQFGRALRSGRRGRRFKSCHLDHIEVKFALLRFFYCGIKEKNIWEYNFGLRGHDIADKFSDMCKNARENDVSLLQFALAKNCNDIDFDKIR